MAKFEHIKFNSWLAHTIRLKGRRIAVRATNIGEVTIYHSDDIQAPNGLLGVKRHDEEYFYNHEFIHLIFPRLATIRRVSTNELRFHMMRMIGQEAQEIVTKQARRDLMS